MYSVALAKRREGNSGACFTLELPFLLLRLILVMVGGCV